MIPTSSPPRNANTLNSLPSEASRTSLVHSRPALSRRQSYTQRRFLAALKTVEEIRALTRPKRIAMEI